MKTTMHGFLWKPDILLIWEIIFSLLWAQEIRLHPKLAQSRLPPQTTIPQHSFQYYLPIYNLIFQVVPSLKYPDQTSVCISYLSCVLTCHTCLIVPDLISLITCCDHFILISLSRYAIIWGACMIYSRHSPNILRKCVASIFRALLPHLLSPKATFCLHFITWVPDCIVPSIITFSENWTFELYSAQQSVCKVKPSL